MFKPPYQLRSRHLGDSPILVLKAVALALVTIAHGCATMSASECTQADWRLVGFADGANGLPQTRIGAHQKACSKAGVTPDLERFLLGHRQGVATYCTATNGFNVGLSGAANSGVCEAVANSQFHRAYAVGRQRHDAHQQVTAAETRLDQLYDREATLQARVSELESAIISAGSTPAARADLLKQIRDCRTELEALEEQKPDYFFAVDRAQEELSSVLAEQSRAGWP